MLCVELNSNLSTGKGRTSDKIGVAEQILKSLRFRMYSPSVDFAIVHVDCHFSRSPKSLSVSDEADAVVRGLTLGADGPLVDDVSANPAFPRA